MPLLLNCLYSFGKFTLDPQQRVLLREGKPLPLTPKVFDTLLILVENKGRLVTKDELMNRLWPKTFVEVTNLTFNIKQLRKTLGDDARNPAYIETIARRGYRFMANVDEVPNNYHAATRPRLPDAVVEVTIEVAGKQSQRASSLLCESNEVAPDLSLDAIPSLTAGSKSSTSEFDPLPAQLAYVRVDCPADNPGDAAKSLARALKSPLARQGAVIVVLAAALVVFWKLSTGSAKNTVNREKVAGKAGRLSPLKLEKLTGTGQSRLVTISLDGKCVAYTHAVDQQSSIWLRQLDSNTNRELVPAVRVVYGLGFANTTESLYYAGGPSWTLYRVSLSGGASTRIVDRVEGNFSLSSDDSQIAFVRRLIGPDGHPEFSLMIVRSDGTDERTLLTRKYPVRIDSPVWSPGNQSIICSMGDSQGGGQEVRIVEVSLAGGLIKELSPERFFHITRMAWLPGKSGLMLSAVKNLVDYNQLW